MPFGTKCDSCVRTCGVANADIPMKIRLACGLCFLFCLQPIRADITTGGSVTPSESSWASGGSQSTTAQVGYSGNGNVLVEGGYVQWGNLYIGRYNGNTGTVNFTDGSLLQIRNTIYVGDEQGGVGKLIIGDNSEVRVVNGFPTVDVSSNGTIEMDNGKLVTRDLYADRSAFSGTGTIETRGLLGSGYATLQFDGTHDREAEIMLTENGDNILLKIEANSAKYLGADMHIQNGASVGSDYGLLGRNAGDVNTVTVTGQSAPDHNDHIWQSRWYYRHEMTVGNDGEGTLNILDGAKVDGTRSSGVAYIGKNEGSQGLAVVSGAESIWEGHSRNGSYNQSTTFIGYDGQGEMRIEDGGYVMSRDAVIGYGSTGSGSVTVDGTGSLWDVLDDVTIGREGTGTLHVANAGLAKVGALLTVTPGKGGITLDGGKVEAGTLQASSTAMSGNGVLDVNGVIGDDWQQFVFDNSDTTTQTYDSGNTTVNLIANGGGTLGANDTLVTNGAQVMFNSVSLGTEASHTSNLVVENTGTKMMVNSIIYVGRDGVGTMTVRDGATVESASSVYIGEEMSHSIGGMGTVNVTGANSVLRATSAMVVGVDGSLGYLNVTDGGRVESNHGYIGDQFLGDGEVLVSGNGSTWDMGEGYLNLGYGADGLLTIEDGGLVSAGNVELHVHSHLATINVEGHGSMLKVSDTLAIDRPNDDASINLVNGGTLDVGTARFDLSFITGEGTILANGVTGAGYDVTLTFDGDNVAGFNLNADGRDIDVTVTADGTGDLGSGNLIARNGAQIQSKDGYVAYGDDDVHTATLEGEGTDWTLSGELFVGHNGVGTLTVKDQASLTAEDLSIAYSHGTGTVNVMGEGTKLNVTDTLEVGSVFGFTPRLNVSDGADITTGRTVVGDHHAAVAKATVTGNGTTWTNEGTFEVGVWDPGEVSLQDQAVLSSGGNIRVGGEGKLDVEGGATLSTEGDFQVDNNGTVNLEVTGNNVLVASGAFDNDGTVTLSAMDGLASGIYRPIAADGFEGNGEFVALDGYWNSVNHPFSYGNLLDGTGGVKDVDLSDKRVTFEFEGMEDLYTQFGADTGNIDFETNVIDPATVGNGTGLAAFDFNTTLAPGSEVMLSYYVGEGFEAEELIFWHSINGEDWTLYSPETFNYDGTYVTFAVKGFSGYAISVVPEPGSATLLLGAGAAWLVRRRRRG